MDKSNAFNVSNGIDHLLFYLGMSQTVLAFKRMLLSRNDLREKDLGKQSLSYQKHRLPFLVHLRLFLKRTPRNFVPQGGYRCGRKNRIGQGLAMIVLSADQMLDRGLLEAGHDSAPRRTLGQQERLRRFKAHYGKSPNVMALIWKDLQTTTIDQAKIDNADENELRKFLWTFNWFKEYSTESVLTGRTRWGDKTIQNNLKEITAKIRALKADKIVWPEQWNDPSVDSSIFIISVDGTHCPIQEPTKGHKYSKNPKYYSHKFNRAALAYEVALSIFTSHVVWVSGPFPAGTQDPEIFAMPGGLKDKIRDGKKVIADSAYKRKTLPMISANNFADSPDVRLFKRRVRARQESIFAKMKVFGILTSTFRHGEDFHCVVFEAIAVIIQYKIEVTPLLDP